MRSFKLVINLGLVFLIVKMGGNNNPCSQWNYFRGKLANEEHNINGNIYASCHYLTKHCLTLKTIQTRQYLSLLWLSPFPT